MAARDRARRRPARRRRSGCGCARCASCSKSTPSSPSMNVVTKCRRVCSPSVTMSMPACSWSRSTSRTASRLRLGERLAVEASTAPRAVRARRATRAWGGCRRASSGAAVDACIVGRRRPATGRVHARVPRQARPADLTCCDGALADLTAPLAARLRPRSLRRLSRACPDPVRRLRLSRHLASRRELFARHGIEVAHGAVPTEDDVIAAAKRLLRHPAPVRADHRARRSGAARALAS